MKKDVVQKPASITPIKTKFLIAEDVLMRGLLWGIVVLVIMGGTAYGIVWFILNVVKPFVNHC